MEYIYGIYNDILYNNFVSTSYSDMPPVVKHYLEQLLAGGAENTYNQVSRAGVSMQYSFLVKGGGE